MGPRSRAGETGPAALPLRSPLEGPGALSAVGDKADYTHFTVKSGESGRAAGGLQPRQAAAKRGRLSRGDRGLPGPDRAAPGRRPPVAGPLRLSPPAARAARPVLPRSQRAMESSTAPPGPPALPGTLARLPGKAPEMTAERDPEQPPRRPPPVTPGGPPLPRAPSPGRSERRRPGAGGCASGTRCRSVPPAMRRGGAGAARRGRPRARAPGGGGARAGAAPARRGCAGSTAGCGGGR